MPFQLPNLEAQSPPMISEEAKSTPASKAGNGQKPPVSSFPTGASVGAGGPKGGGGSGFLDALKNNAQHFKPAFFSDEKKEDTRPSKKNSYSLPESTCRSLFALAEKKIPNFTTFTDEFFSDCFYLPKNRTNQHIGSAFFFPTSERRKTRRPHCRRHSQKDYRTSETTGIRRRDGSGSGVENPPLPHPPSGACPPVNSGGRASH